MIPVTTYYPGDFANKRNTELTDQWLGAIDYNLSKIELPETDKPRFVVCLTSWPKRINYCHVLISSILTKQTVKPDYIFLTLCEAEFPNYQADLPVELVELLMTDERIKLVWNGQVNAKTFKKVFPIVDSLNDEDRIILVDDDNYDKLPADIFESRLKDLEFYDRPITPLLPETTDFISFAGCWACAYKKKMLKNWRKFFDDVTLLGFNDDDFMGRLCSSNGYFPITGSKYFSSDLTKEWPKMCIDDDYGSMKNNVWTADHSIFHTFYPALNSIRNDYKEDLLTRKEYYLDFRNKLNSHIALPIAISVDVQERVDNLLYNELKSLLVTCHFVYDLKFYFFFSGVNYSKITKLLDTYNVKYEIADEERVNDSLEFIRTFDNYDSALNKLAIYDYLRNKEKWYLILDDDIIAHKSFPSYLIDDFLASKMPLGMADDLQVKTIQPVLYTKYGLKNEFNGGVIFVNNEYLPENFIAEWQKVHNDYYRNNPKMPTYLKEQTSLNIYMKDRIYRIDDRLNYKPISAERNAVKSYNAFLFHYAGYNKSDLIRNPLGIPEGWTYYNTTTFRTLDQK